MVKSFIFLFVIFITSLYSIEISIDNNLTIEEQIEIKKQKQLKLQEEVKVKEEKSRLESISKYLFELKVLEEEISKEKVWMKSYASYLTSLQVRESLSKIRKRIKLLTTKIISIAQQDELNALISKEKFLTSQIEKLRDKNASPFLTLITPPNIDKIQDIANPFEIFTAISVIKKLNSDFKEYLDKKLILTDLIKLLIRENNIYKKIRLLDKEDKYKQDALDKAQQLERFKTALDTMIVATDVYEKRLEVVKININKEIEQQVNKSAYIGIFIFIVLFIFMLLKLAIKKYFTDNERFYMANKIINFVNVTIIILIIFFSYIENAGYLVTILGFASAGIAIAMKDWFMSILGWLVIVFGGSIHVGDRIRIDMDGMKYVGDVMDISLLRMTILEDITLTSIHSNRRAGRIIFIPNNYIFTRMVANYTHSSLKTVWDGVHVTITFDSNHKKAMRIAKDVTKKFSKGYTDITRKQLNKLRSHYNLKNTNVEPRIFSFIETNGITIDSWYLTNAYATLTLRSVISLEIIDAFNKEDDITIAYPTQMLHLEKSAKREVPFEVEEEKV